MSTLNYTAQLVVLECCECGLTYGLPAAFSKCREADRKTFYCPAGHAQCYAGESEVARVQRRLAEAERRLASQEEDLRVQRLQTAATERSLRATKGQLTKVTRRAERGVCLHCHRSFVNVARHISSQHAAVRS